MWKCPKCGNECEDNFDRCWNCSAWRDGLPDEQPLEQTRSLREEKRAAQRKPFVTIAKVSWISMLVALPLARYLHERGGVVVATLCTSLYLISFLCAVISLVAAWRFGNERLLWPALAALCIFVVIQIMIRL